MGITRLRNIGVCRRTEKPPAATGRRETSPQELLYRRRISSRLSRQEPYRLLSPTTVSLRVCKEGEREEVKTEFQHLTEKNKRALLIWGTLFLLDGRYFNYCHLISYSQKQIVSRQVLVVNALRLLTKSTTTHFDKYIRTKDES